jgi:hypothetical protein
VADHALDDVPAQALVVAHELLERAHAVREHGFDKGAIGIHGQWDTPGGPAVARDSGKFFDGRLQPPPRRPYPFARTASVANPLQTPQAHQRNRP